MEGGKTCPESNGGAGSEERNAGSGPWILPAACLLLSVLQPGIVFLSM
jgi:hypothetical protein